MVERMIVAVRAGYHAQAAVFSRGIGQVDHREPLLRPRLVALGFGPAPPVLMPEQRRAARGLGDQEPAGPARIARAEAAQRIDQPLVAADVGAFGAIAQMAQRAGRLTLRTPLRPFPEYPAVDRHQPCLLEHGTAQ